LELKNSLYSVTDEKVLSFEIDHLVLDCHHCSIASGQGHVGWANPGFGSRTLYVEPPARRILSIGRFCCILLEKM